MKKIPVYPHAAAGWPSLVKTFETLHDKGCVVTGAKTLMRLNQPNYGVKCTSCAWPDEGDYKPIDFCENGAKATAFEATSKRVTADFFANHTVSELSQMSDYELDQLGRLTQPMKYDRLTDKYVPVQWQTAFTEIASYLQSIGPDQAAFYTSGKVSNEAAFLYQLMVKSYGTNNLPDCSNMCHEPTSIGLAEQIGIGKATVIMSDYEYTDLIMSFGHNPGTNHPRSLTQIRKAKKNGAHYIAINPIKEPSLMEYRHPQSPAEMLGLSHTEIANDFVQLKVGGDTAFIAGVIKAFLEQGTPDLTFIKEHTSGFDEFKTYIESLSWALLVAASGVSAEQMRHVARVYDEKKACIAAWGMGITQHETGVDNVQMIINLLLLKGNIGRPGTGCLPVRGHSNVQGNRTMGIHEKPNADISEAMSSLYGLKLPTEEGMDVTGTLQAMQSGDLKFFMGFAGNFAKATPDWQHTIANMKKLDMTVMVSISLNRSHLAHGNQAYILPALTRTEADEQLSGRQSVSSEDSMCNITPSTGNNTPASKDLMSEPAIIGCLAQALLQDSPIPWEELIADYDQIRDVIAASVPGHGRYNERMRNGRGFYLGNSARDRLWQTDTHKARFMIPELSLTPEVFEQPDILRLTTLRAHGQFNTTIYDEDDRYRGIKAERDVIFMNPEEIEERGLKVDQRVDVMAHYLDPELDQGAQSRKIRGYKLKSLDMPKGSIAAYYPEANVLVPISHHAHKANTPAYKSIPVKISLSV